MAILYTRDGKARTIRATDPKSGVVFKRKTARVYRCLVVRDMDAGTFQVSWHSSGELARKKIGSYRSWAPKAELRVIKVDEEVG